MFKKERHKPLLQPYWCKYVGSPAGRSNRVPHMKSYTRFICVLLHHIPPKIMQKKKTHH